MAAIPEFILRKLYVPGSFKSGPDSFTFDLRNTFAPALVNRGGLAVDGAPLPASAVDFQVEGSPVQRADAITTASPFSMPVGVVVHITARSRYTKGKIQVEVETREAGLLSFSFNPRQAMPKGGHGSGYSFGSRMLMGLYKAEALFDSAAVIGEINPWIYGHFIEHLERCIYGGLWTADGSSLREDTLKLVRALKPSILRYPGGNFSSGYHWEDGVGPKDRRPRRFDEAWQSWESNQVGTAEFIDLCHKTGAEPYLAANDGSGTPDEARRWVAYCNATASQDGGQMRAAHGFPEPFNVKIWGIGNEVWGRWQIGHTTASGYAARLRQFAAAMKEADPSIKLVGVGHTPYASDPSDEGYAWNDTVLLHAGDVIDYLSFHVYNPGEEGWRESYNQEDLHLALASAGQSIERVISRMAAQVQNAGHAGRIQLALDEWNLWMPADPKASSMHAQRYRLRDTLYTAGMLNAFQRMSPVLAMANLAQLVNVLPLIATDDMRAIATAIYWPFRLYTNMESIALKVTGRSVVYATSRLGNLPAQDNVPYLDVTATRDVLNRRLVISLVNRHPYDRAEFKAGLSGFDGLEPVNAWQITGFDLMAENTMANPMKVAAHRIRLPDFNRGRLTVTLPPSSLTLVSLEMRGRE